MHAGIDYSKPVEGGLMWEFRERDDADDFAQDALIFALGAAGGFALGLLLSGRVQPAKARVQEWGNSATVPRTCASARAGCASGHAGLPPRCAPAAFAGPRVPAPGRASCRSWKTA
jgi:hypothetical protein